MLFRSTQVAMVVDDGVRACGVVIPAEDLQALYAALSRLGADESERVRLGQNARAYAVMFLGREEVLLQFEADLQVAAKA